jgi:large subunit ribosomal protein L20
MPRATNNPATRRRRNKILKASKGFHGGRRRMLRRATEAVEKAWANAYRDRRRKKREYRRLWIVRINAAARAHGLSYSVFMHRMNELSVGLDRKQLADLAVHDPKAFEELARQAAQAA